MLDFLKRNKGDVPPDVGKEESIEQNQVGKEEVEEKEEENDEQEDNLDEKDNYRDERNQQRGNRNNKSTRKSSKLKQDQIFSDLNALEFEKINTRIEALSALIKGYSERLSNTSQQIGELRAMNLSNEKAISKSIVESSKAVDIVKEVKPEKLRVDYQRVDLKISALNERIEANKQFEETIMEEIKDLKRKAGIFVGTDSLLKLNEDVKKDLIEIQKVAARVKVNADKSEQIFVELRKNFAEYQKVMGVVNNLDNNYSGILKELNNLKLDWSDVINKSDFEDFKKFVYKKNDLFESELSEIEKIKQNNELMANLIEKILSMSKDNKENIDNIAASMGNDRIKRVADYENQLSSILTILDSLAGEISDIKSKTGIKKSDKGEKIFVEQKEEGKLDLKFINLHPKMEKSLSPKLNSEKIEEEMSEIYPNYSVENIEEKKEGFASKIKNIFSRKKEDNHREIIDNYAKDYNSISNENKLYSDVKKIKNNMKKEKVVKKKEKIKEFKIKEKKDIDKVIHKIRENNKSDKKKTDGKKITKDEKKNKIKKAKNNKVKINLVKKNKKKIQKIENKGKPIIQKIVNKPNIEKKEVIDSEYLLRKRLESLNKEIIGRELDHISKAR